MNSIMAVLACACLGVPLLPGVESAPVQVLQVVDGLTLIVQGQVGGQPIPVAVRLDHIALADSEEDLKQPVSPSTAALGALLPQGSQVVLRATGNHFEAGRDRFLHAIVCQDREASAGAGDSAKQRICIPVELVRSGWARRRNEENDPSPQLDLLLKQAEAEARQAKRGAWANASAPDAANNRSDEK